MLDHQASDEVTDAIAHIEMQRQAAAHEPNPNPVAAGQRALQQLQALHDQESKMPRSEERTASLHTANLEAIQAAIVKLKSRLRPGSLPGGGGGGPRHAQRPVRNNNKDKGGQPRAQGGKPQQGGQGGQRQHQGGQPQGGQRQPQGGQPAPPGGANAQSGQPAPRGPNAPSKKRRGRRSGHRNPNANRPDNA